MEERVNNVDVAARPGERARQFWDILGHAIDIVDVGVAPEIRARARRFMMHLAWHEGRRLVARVQDNQGPARSFLQLEAHRAKDGIVYARQKGWLDRFVALAGGPVTEAALGTAAEALPNYNSADPKASAVFPPGNLIESLLRTVDAFGVAVARSCLRRLPAALPVGAADEAEYWYKHWKITGGDPEALKRTFIDECAEVDTFLPTA